MMSIFVFHCWFVCTHVFACLLTSFVVCCAVMIVGAHNVGCQADVYLCPLSCGLKHDQLRGLINDFVLEVSNISLLRSKLLCLKLLIDDRVTLNFNDVDKENDDDVDFEVQGSLCKYLLIEGLNFVTA